MISENQIIEIRQKADIVDIISSYISLTKKGKNHLGVCPFHDDSNPSMVVSSEKQIFNCFSCGTGGNVFTFVMKYENISFKEALQVVAKKVGINISVGSTVNQYEKYKEEHDTIKLVNKFYINYLNTEAGLKAKEYLHNRGITDDIINEFDIGLSPGNNDLFSFLTNQNKSLELLDNLGLVHKSGINVYDSFKNRIMIPITNLSGDPVGFTGRIYLDSDEAKYINSKETIIFKKGNILFNYYNAKKYVKESKNIILVEGNMDAIKMAASGIKNVVALMGTSLSKEQINVLKKLNTTVTILFDSDNAGEAATIKNGDLLFEAGINTKTVRLSGAKDPDEYIQKNGVEALLNNLKTSINYIDYKIAFLKQNKNLDSAEDLANFIKDIMDITKKLDNITKEVIINKVCVDFNINKAIFNLNDKPTIKEKIEVKETIVRKKDKYDILANKILFYIASDSKYLRIYKSDLNFFREKIERELASEINYFHEHNKGSLADFLTYIGFDEKLLAKTNEIVSELSSEELDNEKFLDYLQQMKKKLDEDEIKILKDKIKNELDMDKKLKLIEKLTKIKKGSVDYE